MKSFSQNHPFYLILIAFLFCILGLLRLNDLSLYTDSTRYLIWGNSIAHGKGFVDDTQPEPKYYVVNAPLFSFILAPVLLFFPLSLIAAKVWTLLWGICALILFFRWLHNSYGQTTALVATLILALNPMALVLMSEVLSEAPFLCIVFGTILLWEQIEKAHCPRWKFILLIVILSTTMLLREVGAALVITSIFFLFFRKRRTLASIVFFFTAAIFALWTYRNLGMIGAPESSQSPNIKFFFQHFVTPPEATLFHELTHRILLNVKSYFIELGGMLFYPFPFNLIVDPSSFFKSVASTLNAVKHFVWILFFPLFIIGVMGDFKHSKTAFYKLLFLCLYICIILVYPVQDVRFLFPLLPFMVIYLIGALERILENIQLLHTYRRAFITVMIVIALIPNIICLFEILHTNLTYVESLNRFGTNQTTPLIQSSYFSTPWKLMGDWIEQELPKGSIIASPTKEIAPFSPNHKFLELNRAVPLPLFEKSLRDNAVEYLLAPTIIDSLTEYQTMIDESPRFEFKWMHSIGRLNIFNVQSKLKRPLYDSTPLKLSLNLEKTRDLLRFGRLALKNEQYSEALSAFSKLQVCTPHFADGMYQLLLVYAFTLDSLHATEKLQELYTLPTSTSYIEPSQIHIDAMNQLLRAKGARDPLYKAEQYYEVARLYWDLGYPHQAYTLVQQAVHMDSTFFVGYLWAWNYGIQLNDTTRAASCLLHLERIDRENPVVKSYRAMTTLHTILNKTYDHRKRSELRLACAREYDKIDLPEEALDETQRAIAEDPTNKNAWAALTALFEKKKHTIAAERARMKLGDLESIRTSDTDK